MHTIGETMNFNHLLTEKRIKIACKGNPKECYWVPTGRIEAMVCENVNVSMRCKKCNAREEAFLTRKEFNTHERVINKEVNNA
jgi:hypothetical protein